MFIKVVFPAPFSPERVHLTGIEADADPVIGYCTGKGLGYIFEFLLQVPPFFTQILHPRPTIPGPLKGPAA